MPQYMLLIYTPAEAARRRRSCEAEMPKWFEYTRGAAARPASWSPATRCSPSSTATTVRVRDGETLITDGPFAETKEVLGGYYLVDVPDLDAALDWAAKIPNVALRLDRGAPGHGVRQTAMPSAAQPSVSDPTSGGRSGAPPPPSSGVPRGRAAVLATLIRHARRLRARRGRRAGRVRRRARAWPRDGVPANPGAWITTTARRKAIDRLRRERPSAPTAPSAAAELAPARRAGSTGRSRGDRASRDDRLRLIFTCCHPALALPARVALTLRSLGGLTTAEIARAFLVTEATMAQRLVAREAQDRRGRHPVPRARPTRSCPSGSQACSPSST